MGKLPIKGGTPIGSASLCRTCRYAQVMTGFRESELLTLCYNVNPTFVVPFNIHDCTSYEDKNRPTWRQMRDLAIDIVPQTLKPVGFKTGAGFATTTYTVAVGTKDDDLDLDD